jgi:hypothetical protein
MTYPIHPLAELFPSIDGAEFYALVASIKAGGLRDAITIHEGAVIDGRNRQRACEAAGVDARYEPLPSDADPLQFVLDRNLLRRHLTESQRASVAAKIENRQHGGDRKTDQDANLHLGSVTRASVAAMLNVSERTIASAAVVLDRGTPELLRAVEQGAVAVSAAAEVAELDEDEQRKVVALGSKEIKARAKELRGKKAKKRKPRWAPPKSTPEQRDELDLQGLQALWEMASDNARAAFLKSVRPPLRAGRAKSMSAPEPAPSRREAICASVKEAILSLYGLPPAHEIAGWFAGSDAASIISERIRPTASWLAEFNDVWKDEK